LKFKILIFSKNFQTVVAESGGFGYHIYE